MDYHYSGVSTPLPKVEWRELAMELCDDEDDRTWQEKCGDYLFMPILWVVIAGIAIGIAGLCFFVGMLGFVSGFALLR